jgi:alkanesulfonate monooxygenase SsuD/methylene tetrahydromethanopterin reductase-like flavin-dependent oxidoreductase (luciferase family)
VSCIRNLALTGTARDQGRPHKPLDIAESLATIDVMSRGSVICGIGLGYREVEYRAFGPNQADAEAASPIWTDGL